MRPQWAGGGGGIRLCRRRARLVQIGGADSGRLRNHSLHSLGPRRDVFERVDGRAHQMTRDHMIWSAHRQATHGHAHVGGTWSRFAGNVLHESMCRFGWKKNPHPLSMAAAKPHVAAVAAVTR